MSKLWIVHRNPRHLQALARLSGLAPPDLVFGGPTGEAFAHRHDAATASPPAAILIGIQDDFELELEFFHRHRDRLESSKRLLLTAPQDFDEVQRLFGASPAEILTSLPSERELRALILSAVAHRNAETLAQRRDRSRIADRFKSWFGDLDLPGLLRTLDPALASLPLLVRGVPGSGRALVARYVELFRVNGAAGPTLRVHAREASGTDEIVARLQARERAGLPSIRTIWIDEIDSISVSAQRAVAEWIRLDAAPAGSAGSDLRWIATAGPAGLTDRLDEGLERAFAPLTLLVPSLAERPDALAPFAQQVASVWTATVGGGPRRIGASAIGALEAHAWFGDRAAVEAVLRSTLAATSANPIEEVDLVSTQPPWSLGREEPDRASDEEPVDRPVTAPIEALMEEAVFADASPALDPFGEPMSEVFSDGLPDASSETGPVGLGPQEARPPPAVSPELIDEIERAFLERLPATDPNQPSATIADSAPRLTDQDVSTHMSEESFAAAGTDIAATAATLAQEPEEPDAASRAVSPTAASAANVAPPARADWRRLARSLSHEIRNPLVSIRTFAQLLPEHFADESFRARFTELVGRDVAHIDEVVSRLASAAEREKSDAGRVDVSEMIEKLLDQRRDRIGQGRLLVLRELEREAPIAWADAHALEVALAGLIDRALASLPERGDLFVATRHIERSADGAPRLRVLLRHHNPELGALDGSGLEELGSAANVLEYVLAETIVETHGGTLTIDSTDAQETLILVDLRTPASPA